jgi:nicotinamidase-related amidase
MEHPSGINPKIVEKVVARRGRLHAFEQLDGPRTALVVIDLMQASIELDAACLDLVAPVEAVAARLRRCGGTVAWVTAAQPAHDNPIMAAIHGRERYGGFVDMARSDHPSSQLWREFSPAQDDLHAKKSGYSAFFPGKCDLHGRLQRRGIDTLLIAGTVTNICCESSVRDAVELGYRVVMISDATAGHAHGLHEATLATIYRCFGDVRPTAEILHLLGEVSALDRAPEAGVAELDAGLGVPIEGAFRHVRATRMQK